MGPTFPVVHKLCVCVLEVEERKERIKTPVWMSFSSRHGADCQRVATLTIDQREEQAEQQTLQPRHCSYRCWHCMCVRNSGISSKYKLNSTPVPRSVAASHSHPKVYICIACRRHVYIESLPTLWYLRIESASPSDRANTQCPRHSSPGHLPQLA